MDFNKARVLPFLFNSTDCVPSKNTMKMHSKLLRAKLGFCKYQMKAELYTFWVLF